MIMKSTSSKPSDKLRAECLELSATLIDHVKLLRDYATTPGNAWLAKGELSKVSTLTSELSELLEQLAETVD